MSEDKTFFGINKADHTVEYNPDKFWKENTMKSLMEQIQQLHEADLAWKKKTNWKPEYFISIGEAKTANLFHLQWLCNNYRVIGGSKAVNTVRQREIIINFKKQF